MVRRARAKAATQHGTAATPQRTAAKQHDKGGHATAHAHGTKAHEENTRGAAAHGKGADAAK